MMIIKVSPFRNLEHSFQQIGASDSGNFFIMESRAALETRPVGNGSDDIIKEDMSIGEKMNRLDELYSLGGWWSQEDQIKKMGGIVDNKNSS